MQRKNRFKWLLLVACLLCFTPLATFWLYAVLSPYLLVNVVAWSLLLLPFFILIKHVAAQVLVADTTPSTSCERLGDTRHVG